jgi:hypothetical protein
LANRKSWNRPTGLSCSASFSFSFAFFSSASLCFFFLPKEFAKPHEKILDIFGLILAAASGAAQPLMTLIFGRLGWHTLRSL